MTAVYIDPSVTSKQIERETFNIHSIIPRHMERLVQFCFTNDETRFSIFKICTFTET